MKSKPFAISAIVAVDNNGGIAADGVMPWPRDSQDLARFRSITQNQIVIMGRKTWDAPDMPSPLPNRINIVVSRHGAIAGEKQPDAIICPSQIGESLELIQESWPEKRCFCIGGSQVLELLKPNISTLYLTEFVEDYKCNIRLNMENMLNGMKCQNREILQNKIWTTWIRD